MEDAFGVLDKSAFESLIMLTWNIWNSRNKLVFKGKVENAKNTWENAKNTWENAKHFLDDFRLYNLTLPPLFPPKVTVAKWLKSPASVIKINVNAACNSDGMGIGVLARDHEGFVVGGRMYFSDVITSCTWVEAKAVYMGFSWAKEKYMNEVIIEGNCACIINKINSGKEDITTLGLFLKGLKNSIKYSNKVTFKWCKIKQRGY